MKKIVVSGPNNSGKSTTIRALVSSLVSSERISDTIFLKIGKQIFSSISPALAEEQVNQGHDFVGVFKCSGHLVGITSFGDSMACLNEAFAIFNQHSCEFCVFACRTNESDTYKATIAMPDILAILFKAPVPITAWQMINNEIFIQKITVLLP